MSTDKTYKIDGLAGCDNDNLAESKRARRALAHADSLSATDECATLLERIGVLFGEACDYDKYNQQVNNWLKGSIRRRRGERKVVGASYVDWTDGRTRPSCGSKRRFVQRQFCNSSGVSSSSTGERFPLWLVGPSSIKGDQYVWLPPSSEQQRLQYLRYQPRITAIAVNWFRVPLRRARSFTRTTTVG